MSLDAACATHPQTPADGTCDRCGTFGCPECLRFTGTARLCAECLSRQVAELPPLGFRGWLARAALYGMAGAHLLIALLVLASTEGLNPLAGRISPFAFNAGYFTAYVAAGVVFVQWFALAVRYSEGRGVGLVVSPFHAIGIWFVPFANFTRPFELTRQMLRGTGGSLRLVGWWQAFWVLGNVGSQVTGATGNTLGLVISSLLMVAAAVAGASVVSTLTHSIGSRAPPAAAAAPAAL